MTEYRETSPEQQESQKRLERVSKFVRPLIEDGVQPIRLPNDPDRSFFLVSRKIKNPAISTQTVDKQTFSQLGKWAAGFTSAWILDIIEEIPPGSKHYIPVGHRDLRVARFDDGNVIASGNMNVNRGLARKTPNHLSPEFAHACQEADALWGMNGIDVLPSMNEALSPNYDEVDVEKERLAGFFTKHKISPDQSWRRLGLGKLLTGVEMELLRQLNVERLEAPSVSESLRGIHESLYTVADMDAHSRVVLSRIPQDRYVSMIDPFIPKE